MEVSMTIKLFHKQTAGLFMAAALGLLMVSEARADHENKDVTLVPEQAGPSACAAGTTPTERAECERWYYMTEKANPDAWQEDHPAFSKKQRWYHVGQAKAPAAPRI